MTERIQKVNQLIQKETARFLLREVDFPKGVLVTVSRADCSPNLIQAKIHLSILPSERQKEIFKILKRRVFSIQKKLNKLLKMRPVPKIIFVQEKRSEKVAKVEEILERIKKEEA